MNEGRQANAATTLEWVSAALGAAVTLATLGFLLYEGITDPGEGMPELVVQVDSVTPARTGWTVTVEARNVGSATAAAVRVVGELREGGQVVESSELTLDYVPERSSRSGALLFARDPAGLMLEVRPVGYARP